MPEALAVLLVFVVAVSSYVAARVQTGNPANADPAADLQRLHQHRAWLDERLRQAQRENWDQAMLARLSEQIQNVEAEIAKSSSATRDAA
jgi:hypothetical protein